MAQASLDQVVDARAEATSPNRRERGVGKLIEKVPSLLALRLTVAEARASGWQGRGYARYIDLERALALFEVPCSYAHCQGGGYDLTGEVLAGLRLQRAHFEGRQTCAGRCGSVDCARLLYFEAKATYAPGPGARVESPAFEPALDASPFAPRRMLWLTRATLGPSPRAGRSPLPARGAGFGAFRGSSNVGLPRAWAPGVVAGDRAAPQSLKRRLCRGRGGPGHLRSAQKARGLYIP